MSEPQEPSIIPAALPCKACNECSYCMTLKNLCGYTQSLSEQLELAQQQANEASVNLLNSTTECEELKERVSGLESHCGLLEGSLSETRMQQLAVQQKLQSQQVKSEVLHSENRTLWQFLGWVQLIASNTEQPLQQLFNQLRVLRFYIIQLKAERYGKGMQETSHQGSEGWVTIEDNNNDQTEGDQLFTIDQN